MTELTPPQPLTPGREDRVHLLAASAPLTRVYGADLEASIARGLSDTREALNNPHIATRITELRGLADDLTGLLETPNLPADIHDAATQRLTDITATLTATTPYLVAQKASTFTSPTTPSSARVFVGKSTAKVILLTHDPATLHDGLYRDMTPLQRVRDLRNSTPVRWMVFTLTLLVIASSFTAQSMMAHALLVMLALVMFTASPWATRTLDAAERDATTVYQRIEKANSEAEEFSLDHLCVLHQYTPNHPVWSTPHPGLSEPTGTPEPVWASLCEGITRQDPVQVRIITGWIETALPLLATYADTKNYDPSNPTDKEKSVMTRLADFLFEATRNREEERENALAIQYRAERLAATQEERENLLNVMHDSLFPTETETGQP